MAIADITIKGFDVEQPVLDRGRGREPARRAVAYRTDHHDEREASGPATRMSKKELRRLRALGYIRWQSRPWRRSHGLLDRPSDAQVMSSSVSPCFLR